MKKASSKALSQLKSIENEAVDLNKKINEEQRVYEAELKDRRRFGLSGDEGQKHYNDWMAAHNMQHLMLKE